MDNINTLFIERNNILENEIDNIVTFLKHKTPNNEFLKYQLFFYSFEQLGSL